jgi:hypothetical protein
VFRDVLLLKFDLLKRDSVDLGDTELSDIFEFMCTAAPRQRVLLVKFWPLRGQARDCFKTCFKYYK